MSYICYVQCTTAHMYISGGRGVIFLVMGFNLIPAPPPPPQIKVLISLGPTPCSHISHQSVSPPSYITLIVILYEALRDKTTLSSCNMGHLQ